MPHRSFELLRLAKQSGITTGGARNPLSDGQLDEFREQYAVWSSARDRSLREHVSARSTLFRTLLPYNERAFPIAYNLQWYFDEILVRDPVSVLLENDSPYSGDQLKTAIAQAISVLEHFKPALQAGHVLLYGGLAGRPPVPAPEFLAELATRPTIASSLRDAAECGLERRLGDDGHPWQVYRIDLDGVGMLGWHAEQLSGEQTSPAIRIDEKFSHATLDQVTGLLGDESRLTEMFPSKVERTLRAVDTAERLRANPLFDREVDAMIVNEARATSHGAAAIETLNLTLPYLESVRPELLTQLRDEDPLAFSAFRSKMHDVVRMGVAGDLSEPLATAAARDIVPELRAVEQHMSALAARRSVQLAVVSGVLGGILASPAIAIPLGGAALAWAAKQVHDDINSKAAVRMNPFYWLWRARTASQS